jgi:hypothetical protein
MKLINKLRDAWLTHQETDELEQYIMQLEADANRYRWLNKYTAQLLMVTEQQMNEQIDTAMGQRHD